MTNIERDFDQLSPLMDDVMKHVKNLNCSGYEKAAIAAMLVVHMSVSTNEILMKALESGERVSRDTALKVAHIMAEHNERASARNEFLADKLLMVLQ